MNTNITPLIKYTFSPLSCEKYILFSLLAAFVLFFTFIVPVTDLGFFLSFLACDKSEVTIERETERERRVCV